MTHRIIISIVAAALLVTLILPSAALAVSSFEVRDSKGHLRGTVQYSDLFGADVNRKDGSLAGRLSSQDSGGGSFYGVIKGSGNVPPQSNFLGYVGRNKFYPPRQPGGLSRVTGKAVRVGQRWVVKKKVAGVFRRVGTVPGTCRVSYAMGAGRLLLW